MSAKHALTVGIGFIVVLGLGCGDGARPFGGDPFDPPGSGGTIGSAGSAGASGTAGASGSIGSVAISLPGSGGGSAHPTDASVDSTMGTGGRAGTGGALGTTPTGGNPAAATGGVGGRVSNGSGGSSQANGGATAPTSTGGAPGTGGARGTGGAGTGGAHVGTGGANGTGGATAGTGGAPATASECQQYKDDYEGELQNARSCKDNKEKSCATLVPSKLTGCGSECETFVDKSAMLDQIQKKWAKAGCVAERCLVSICVTPIASTCSAVTELCTDGLLGF